MLVLALAGCAVRPPVPDVPADPSLPSRCERAFAGLDAAIERAGVRDAEATPVAGFPALRLTRFLASFADPAMDDPTFRSWYARLADEGRKARLVEIANLPPPQTQDALEALRAEGFAALPPQAFIAGCAQALAERDAADPVRRGRLLAARVPDDYDDTARALGLYPLTRVGFAVGVRAYEQSVLDRFASPAPLRGTLVAYVPGGPPVLSAAEVQAMLARGAADPLGIPALDELDVEQLLATYAPVLEVDERDANDRLGRPVPTLHGTVEFVPMPVVFGRVAFTRFAGATHVQLVYTAWFAARTSAYPGDPLAGRLDGVLWRVTLDRDGAPLVFDSIHACGCYALFATTPRVVARPSQRTLDEQALVPATLPDLAPGERIVVALASGTHQVRGVRPAAPLPPGAPVYRLGAEDALRSIVREDGSMRSLYGPDGMVAGTERAERALFWPLGIRDAGAMRQWGRHATAFIGRRHFDEAFLLDRYFLPAR